MLIGQRKEVLLSFPSITSHKSEITGGRTETDTTQRGRTNNSFAFANQAFMAYNNYSL